MKRKGEQALGFTCLQYLPFENTVGKREIARNEQFLLFPSFLYAFSELSPILVKFKNCRLQTLSIWNSLNCVLWERVKTVKQLLIGYAISEVVFPSNLQSIGEKVKECS